MHIALYLASLPWGGTERVAVNLAEYLHGNGHSVTIVTTYKLDDEMPLSEGISRVVTEPADMVFDGGRIANFRKRCANLRKVWSTIAPDVILSFIGKNNMMALLTTGRMNIPVYVAVRGEPTAEYYNSVLRLVSKTLFGKAAGIIMQTRQSISYFPKRLQKKCVILRNPLNPKFAKPNISRTPEHTIVTVGRCDSNKNQKMLIDAFASIADEYPDWNVTMYGDGELRENLIHYVADKGLSNRISLPGVTNDTREAIKNAGIFVLASDTEGMPNALIEAMCMGLAVISTDCPCGGPAELIEDGDNGLLVPVRDTNALSQAMSRIMADSELREKLGRAAMGIREELNPKKVNKEWEEYLLGQIESNR